MFVVGGAESLPVHAPPPPPPQEKPAPHLLCPAQMSDAVHPGAIVSSVFDWSKVNNTTVGGAAHGLISTPGVLAKHLLEAAKTNTEVAKKITDVLNAPTPETRQTAIDAFKKAAAETASEPLVRYAETLSSENHAALFAGAVAKPFDAMTHAVGSGMRGLVERGISAAPESTQGFLRAGFSRFQTAFVSRTQGLRDARAALSDISPATRSKGTIFIDALKAQASTETSSARGALRTGSRYLGWTLGESASKFGVFEKSVNRFDVIKDTPVVGLALTGLGVFEDKGSKGWGDAILGNVGSNVIGSKAGSIGTKLFSKIGNGSSDGVDAAADAGADVAADAGGDAAATAGSSALVDGAVDVLAVGAEGGPGGLAIAGGVLVAAGIGYGAYKLLETKPAQEAVHAAEHGVEDAGKDVGHLASSGFDAAKHFFSGL